MLRLASWIRPAGGSPVRVGVGAPGSRPRSRGEILAAERGVESLFGGSKRAGCDCSLVRSTIGEPSRSCQARSTHPGGHKPVVGGERNGQQGHSWVDRASSATRQARGSGQATVGRARRAAGSRRGDTPRAARSRPMPVDCVAAPGRSSLSRVRENRTHGLKGESGNGLA